VRRLSVESPTLRNPLSLAHLITSGNGGILFGRGAFFIAWLLLEDLARKYLGNNVAVYFAKDVVLAMVYLSFFLALRRREKVQTFRPPFLAALLLFFWFGVMQIFNPGSSSLL
jgi:hypothetical protein